MAPQSEVTGVPVLRPAQVLERVASPGTDTRAPLGTPVLAVAVDGEDDEVHALPGALRHLPCVVVGVGSGAATSEPAPDLDVLLTDVEGAPAPWRSCPEGVERALSTLALSVLCAPQAATTLVQVLRISRYLSFEDALVVEAHAHALLRAGPEFAAWRAGYVPSARPRDLSPVEVRRRDGTLAVTLRRAQGRNALDVTSRGALTAAFELAAHDPTLERVDLKATGPDFCTGDDLDELAAPGGGAHSGATTSIAAGTGGSPLAAPADVAGHLDRTARNPARALWRCADRATAYVHGACVGAGVELAAAAGRVVAAPGTTFELPEVRMGIIPGTGGTASLPRRIGRQRTAWMALTGVPLDLATARDWGLVDVG